MISYVNNYEIFFIISMAIHINWYEKLCYKFQYSQNSQIWNFADVF